MALIGVFSLGVGTQSFAQAPLSVNAAIKTALHNNPSYQSQDMGVDIARLSLDKAKAGKLPTLDLRGGYTRYSDPMIIVPIHETGIFPELDQDIFTSGLYAQMPLYTGGRLSASKDMARANIAGTQQRKEIMKQDLIFSVMQYYSELLTVKKLQQASDQRLAFYRKEQNRVDLLLSQGKATRLDQAKINTQLEKARYERLQLDMAFDQNIAMLSSLMSAEVPSTPELERFYVTQSVLPASLDVALDITKREHPALLEARTRVEIAQSKVKIAKAAKRPQVSAVGNARTMAGGNLSAQNEWQVGIQFSVPIFDGKIKNRSVQQAQLEKTQSRLALGNLINQTNAATIKAWQSMAVSKNGIRVSRAALEQAEEALRIETLRYENNRSTINDLTLAEAEFWQAASNLVKSENTYELSKALLLKTMGVLQTSSLVPAVL
jgi:outer membrane protein TolC